jgi:multiple RNA-binding domain-containing protein 1
MAVVEYERPDEAAKGFRAVAYRRLGNSIIYLEKGPLGMFVDGFVPESDKPSKPIASSSTVRVAEQIVDGPEAAAAVEGEPPVQGGTTLYLKNLAFSTTQERLTQVFSHLPSFSFARVQTKPDPQRPGGARLSMGYGFMGFKDAEGAKSALKSVQGFVLDGHALHVSFAGRGAGDVSQGKDLGVGSKNRTTKMIVKNVPFEATKKDIRELFGCIYTPSTSLVVLFFLTGLLSFPFPQLTRPPQICTPAQEIRLSLTRLCIP